LPLQRGEVHGRVAARPRLGQTMHLLDMTKAQFEQVVAKANGSS
jgi:hypothetical protein